MWKESEERPRVSEPQEATSAPMTSALTWLVKSEVSIAQSDLKCRDEGGRAAEVQRDSAQ